MPHRNQNLPVIVTCSGSSDVGELADKVGRELSRSGIVHLECSAGVGAMKESTLGRLRQAKVVLAIDGCASRCVHKSMERACLEGYRHLDLCDLGFLKDHSPVDEATVKRATEAAKVLLGV